MSRGLWWCLRRGSGLAVLAVVVAWLWPGPVLHGIRTVDGSTLRCPASRSRAVLRSDVRDMLLVPRTWSGVALASVLAVLVLVATALPLNVGGWGPRAGVSAWAFGAAGLGAVAGLATVVVYGVMVLVADLPGAIVMAVDTVRGAPRA